VDSTSVIAEISCQRSSGCQCVSNQTDTCEGLGLDSLTYDSLDVNTCKVEKCVAPSCSFWKYLKNKEANVFTKHCYLMNKDQCTAVDEDVVCPDDDEHDPTQPTCRSGVRDPEECESEPPSTTVATPTTAEPTITPCPGPIAKNDDKTTYYQAWNCVATINGHLKPWDMYNEESMPVGGYCLLDKSAGSCLSAPSKYECKGDDGDGTGKWQDPAGGQDYVDTNGTNILMEVGCKAEDLEIPEALVHQDGRLITCSINEYDESTKNISAENDCIMLCDAYPVFSFYTDFKSGEEGRDWFYELIDTPSSNGQLNAGMLDCWGKR